MPILGFRRDSADVAVWWGYQLSSYLLDTTLAPDDAQSISPARITERVRGPDFVKHVRIPSAQVGDYGVSAPYVLPDLIYDVARLRDVLADGGLISDVPDHRFDYWPELAEPVCRVRHGDEDSGFAGYGSFSGN